MRMLMAFMLSGLAVGTFGCASITGGTTQQITVTTNPADARCVFEREGQQIGSIERTAGALLVQRRKQDITIKCTKAGYQEAVYLNHSGLSGAVAANVAVDLLLTGGISSIVDSASGADNAYTEAVNITLVPIMQ